MKMSDIKLIELWKPDCPDCEATEPIIAGLEKEGYLFERHNIFELDGRDLWGKYEEAIDAYSQSRGWETGYIYTPTFINPKTGKAIAFANRAPKKEELIQFAQDY